MSEDPVNNSFGILKSLKKLIFEDSPEPAVPEPKTSVAQPAPEVKAGTPVTKNPQTNLTQNTSDLPVGDVKQMKLKVWNAAAAMGAVDAGSLKAAFTSLKYADKTLDKDKLVRTGASYAAELKRVIDKETAQKQAQKESIEQSQVAEKANLSTEVEKLQQDIEALKEKLGARQKELKEINSKYEPQLKDIDAKIALELKSQLPIFQVLGDHLPSQLQTPEAKKTISSIFFWALILGGAFAFFKLLPTMLEYAKMSILMVIFSIILIVLLMLAPKIIGLLHRLGTVLIFKGEKAIIRNNPIETLQLLSKDAKDTLKRVKDKIANVDGVRIDMIQSGETAQKTAEEKYTYAKRFTVEAANLDEKSKQESANNNPEKANDYTRDAKETRTKAFLLGKEGEAEEQNARSYVQYANQFAKVLEVLKDNESAARIYVSTLDSSISIISKKLEATQKMKNATEGLAEVFNIKDGWVFQEAMDAATGAISQNIASIRSNLDFLDQNNNITVGGAPSQGELEEFIKKVDERNLKMLNVSKMADSYYELKPEEKVDKGFSLLD
eukprot:gene21442-25461_t